MDCQGQQDVDDDVYVGEVPEPAYMESDADPLTDAEAAASDSKSEVYACFSVPQYLCV